MVKLFSIDECNEVIRFAEEKNDWLRKDHSPIKSKYYTQDINELYSFKIRVKNYIESELNIKIDNPGIAVLKYDVGDGFVRHIDRGSSSAFNSDFLYNVNILLNSEFEGGEVYIDDKLIDYNKPGYIYYYKSTTYHEVKPITRGIRYTVIFYIRERDMINTKDKLI